MAAMKRSLSVWWRKRSWRRPSNGVTPRRRRPKAMRTVVRTVRTAAPHLRPTKRPTVAEIIKSRVIRRRSECATTATHRLLHHRPRIMKQIRPYCPGARSRSIMARILPHMKDTLRWCRRLIEPVNILEHPTNSGSTAVEPSTVWWKYGVSSCTTMIRQLLQEGISTMTIRTRISNVIQGWELWLGT